MRSSPNKVCYLALVPVVHTVEFGELFSPSVFVVTFGDASPDTDTWALQQTVPIRAIKLSSSG